MADSPSHAHTLVLVANRDATSLTPVDIEAARDLARTAAPVTLSEGEAVEMACTTPDIAAHAGIGEKIAEITRRSMNGEIEFEAALRERVALLRGLPVTLLEKAWKDVKLNTGAAELVRTMRANGARTALVSGGFTFFTSRVAGLCGFDENHANTLLAAGDSLTGAVGQPILGPDAKLAHLRRLVAAQDASVEDALATGDGANDLAMLRVAGLGIAFHAKPAVRREISNQVNATTLRSLLFAQGYRAAEFVTA